MRAVLERDFLAEASGPRAFRSRTYLGLLVALGVTIVLCVMQEQLRLAPDKVAAEVFRVGASIVVVMLALLAPGAVVGSILNERTQETLPLVLATPVGPLGFAFAKFLSRAGVVLTYGLAALLPLGMTVLLGGVGGTEVLKFVALCAGVVVELAGWSLWVSCVSRRPATAAVLSYLLPAGRWGLCWAAGLVASYRGHATGPFFLESTPFPAFLDVTDPGSGWSGAAGVMARGYAYSRSAPVAFRTGGDPLLFFLATALAFATVFVLLSARRLRSEGEPARGRTVAPPKPGKQRKPRRGPPAGNPVLWKEGRLLSTGASRPLFYSVFFAMLLIEIGFWYARSAQRL